MLGDPVNVASRLEHATRVFDVPMLASAEVVAAAGEPAAAWREVSREPLPGMSCPIALLTPTHALDEGSRAAAARPEQERAAPPGLVVALATDARAARS